MTGGFSFLRSCIVTGDFWLLRNCTLISGVARQLIICGVIVTLASSTRSMHKGSNLVPRPIRKFRSFEKGLGTRLGVW